MAEDNFFISNNGFIGYKINHPVRLNLSARISQTFSSIFLSQQISISTSTSTGHHPANGVNMSGKGISLNKD
jgi:hypothetical protein